jgi:ribosomal protein L37AE/L43A
MKVMRNLLREAEGIERERKGPYECSGCGRRHFPRAKNIIHKKRKPQPCLMCKPSALLALRRQFNNAKE